MRMLTTQKKDQTDTWVKKDRYPKSSSEVGESTGKEAVLVRNVLYKLWCVISPSSSCLVGCGYTRAGDVLTSEPQTLGRLPRTNPHLLAHLQCFLQYRGRL